MKAILPFVTRALVLGFSILSAVPGTASAATADLALDLYLPGLPSTGFPYTNELTVVNKGPDSANPRLQLAVDGSFLGASFQLLSVSTSRGTVSVHSGKVLGELGPMSVGQTAVVTVVYLPTRTGQLSYSSEVQDVGVSDPIPGNNYWQFILPVGAGQGVVQFANFSNSGREGSIASVTILRTGNIQGTVGAHYAARNGAAQAGDDFTFANGLVTFGPGETMKTLRIPLTADRLTECPEDFSIGLFDAFGPAVAAGQSNTTVMIQDQNWRLSGTIRGVSVLPGHPSRTASRLSGGARVSADGRHVVFFSEARDLAGPDMNDDLDIYLRDLDTGVTSLISVNRLGTAAAGGDAPAINADGQFVAFQSSASDITTNDNNGLGDVFVRDRQNARSLLVSVTPEGNSGNQESFAPLISSNGQVVVFLSLATDLVSGTSSGQQNIFLRDLSTGLTRLVSRRKNSASEGNGPSFEPALSANGRYVAFESDASNLVNQDQNGDTDVFLYDRVADELTLISAPHTGAGTANAVSYGPVISADGGVIAFVSRAADLVLSPPVQAPGKAQDNIYVRDRIAATTRMITVNQAGTADASGGSFYPSLSAAGDRVAFSSQATNLVAGAGFSGGQERQMFVRDLPQGQTALVTFNCEGSRANNGDNVGGLTADGRHVVFVSTGSDLTPGLNPQGAYQTYRRDLQSGVTESCSFNYTYTGSASGPAFTDVFPFPTACSADGSVIALESDAGDLVANDTNQVYDVFVWQALLPGNNAQLRLTVTTGAGQGVVFWKMAATNYGPQTATAVVVTNPLPPGCTLLAAHSTTGTRTTVGGVVRWELGGLPAGRGAEAYVFALAPAAGSRFTTAGVAALENDPFLLDNIASFFAVTSMPLTNYVVHGSRLDSWACLTWVLNPPGVLVRSDSIRNGTWTPVAASFIDNGVVAGWVGDIRATGNASFFRVRRP